VEWLNRHGIAHCKRCFRPSAPRIPDMRVQDSVPYFLMERIPTMNSIFRSPMKLPTSSATICVLDRW